MNVKVGFQLAPTLGDMGPMREAWMAAEALGVDALYTADHFIAIPLTSEVALGQRVKPAPGKNFEATTIQAAMAATTTRAEIGCIVHATSFRNPNLMADIARTIDHISGGRYILGMGSGYLKADYEEYGYAFGTQKERSLALARDIPMIRARFDKLNPKPLRKIPLLIGSRGGKIGSRIVAEHADIWHANGPIEQITENIENLKAVCKEIGRDFSEIELATYLIEKDADPDVYLNLGFRQIIRFAQGPKWDMGQVRELLEWRKNLSRD